MNRVARVAGARIAAAGLALLASLPAAGADPPVSFATQVAPVLLDACTRCHGETEDEGGLRMDTIQAMLAAKVVEPGKGAASLLVKKLRGVDIDGQRMPLGKPPLAADVIARIEAWIDQGARSDMLGIGASLEAIVSAGRVAKLSDADLAAVRREAASVAWRRAIPDEDAAVAIRDRISVVGNLPPPRLGDLADMATEVEARVRTELVGDAGRLLKGGVVILAFRNSYDYSAFWQEVVGGERPKGLAGHAGRSGEAVYGAVLVPAADDGGDDTRLLLAEQIAGAALIGRGAPAWFARGAGRALATRISPKAPLAQVWKREVPAAVREVGACANLLNGRAAAGAAAVAAGGFVGGLAPTSAKLKTLVAAVDGGVAFDDAFAKAFRAAPSQLYDAWAAKESRRAPPAR
jgi:hypothetical protein